MAQTSNISFWLKHSKNVERDSTLLVQSLFFRFKPEKTFTKNRFVENFISTNYQKKLARAKKITKKNALQ